MSPDEVVISKKKSLDLFGTENDLLDFKNALRNAVTKFKEEKPSFE